MSDQITLSIDGRDVSVPRGTTIFDAARLHGIPIPTLCHQQNQTPVGVCRVCVVDVGARVYPASCIRECERKSAKDRGSGWQPTDRPAICRMQGSGEPIVAGAPRRAEVDGSRESGRAGVRHAFRGPSSRRATGTVSPSADRFVDPPLSVC